MKKKLNILILTIIFFVASNMQSFAGDNIVDNARVFFQNYIKLCYAYDRAVVDQYSDNALIKRILIYPSGKADSVSLSAIDYKNRLKFYRYLAMIRKYRNVYSSLTFTPEGNNVRISGYRQVVSENYKTPVSILVGKDSSGKYVILEEILHTKGVHFFKKK